MPIVVSTEQLKVRCGVGTNLAKADAGYWEFLNGQGDQQTFGSWRVSSPAHIETADDDR